MTLPPESMGGSPSLASAFKVFLGLGPPIVSFTHRPAPLLARQLVVRTVVFIRILNGRHAVDGRSALELDPLVDIVGCA
jgi:hypothetical protein